MCAVGCERRRHRREREKERASEQRAREAHRQSTHTHSNEPRAKEASNRGLFFWWAQWLQFGNKQTKCKRSTKAQTQGKERHTFGNLGECVLSVSFCFSVGLVVYSCRPTNATEEHATQRQRQGASTETERRAKIKK